MNVGVAKIIETKLTAYGKSDIGRVRANNEDRFYFHSKKGIFLVVDGMGGHLAGEVAAEIACETITKRLERETANISERIREAITLANNEIFRQSQSNEKYDGMACVLTVAVVENNLVTVGHIGDSRLYLLTAEKIKKMTNDHSPVGVLEDICQITELEAMQHTNRNEVFRDVGSTDHSPNDVDFIDIYEFEMPSESALILCSDGLTDLVTENRIFNNYLLHQENPITLVETLIDEANQAGGKDNITIVAVTNSSRAYEFSKQKHQTLDSNLNDELKEIIAEHTDGQKTTSNLFKRIFFSHVAFFVYGILLAVLGFWVWVKYFIKSF